MSQCTDPIVDENIDYCPNDEIASGVNETEIYGAKVSDFLEIKSVPALADATTHKEAATIAGTHTFKPGKGFHKLNVIPDTGNVESPLVGSKGSKSVNNRFAGTLPSTSARNKGYGRRHKNAPMVYLVKVRTGEMVQIGGVNGGAYFEEYSPNTGTAPEDVNGIPFVISAIDVVAAPVYTGTITTIDDSSASS